MTDRLTCTMTCWKSTNVWSRPSLPMLFQNSKIHAVFLQACGRNFILVQETSLYFRSPKPQTGTICHCEKVTSVARIRPALDLVQFLCTYLTPGVCSGEISLLKMYAKDFQSADKLQYAQCHRLGKTVRVSFSGHLGFRYMPGEDCRGITVSWNPQK